MFTWANFALQVAKFLNALAALFRSKKDRDAGRTEAILEQKQATDAEIDKALGARRDQQRIDDAGGLRAPDKFSRT